MSKHQGRTSGNTTNRRPDAQGNTHKISRKLPYIFGGNIRLEEKFQFLLEDSHPDHTVYVYHTENSQVIKPYIYRGRVFRELLDTIRDYIGAGDFAILIRDHEKMIFVGIASIGVPKNWTRQSGWP